MSLDLQNVAVVAAGQTIIDNVSLKLERGSMNVLLGPTLAGKTSLMRLMAGLDKPTSGQILLEGKDVVHTPVRKRSVAMVYQQFVNYPSLTVYENIASPLRVQRLPTSEIESRVLAAANLLKLEPLLKRLPSQISGGQQQRTAIARAIVKRADVVMLDEPLANLDYKLREELREELPRIFKESGAILVYATTEPLEALMLGGNTATLSKGRLVEFGSTPKIYHDTGFLESARVFSDPPLNETSMVKTQGDLLIGGSVRLKATGTLAQLADGEYTLAFRADIVTLSAAWKHSISLSGSVAVAEISGSESFVHVKTVLGTLVCVEAGVSKLQPGDTTQLHVDASRIFVFDKSGRRVPTGKVLN